jgi:hypothetical protein
MRYRQTRPGPLGGSPIPGQGKRMLARGLENSLSQALH